MSWGVNVVGTKAEIVEYLKRLKAYSSSPGFETLRANLIAQVELFPDIDGKVLHFESSGHIDAWSAHANTKILSLALAKDAKV